MEIIADLESDSRNAYAGMIGYFGFDGAMDTCLAILRVLHEGFGNPKYAPCPLLVQMVTAGKLGVKSGEGFYSYTAGSKDLVVAPSFR